MSRSGRRGEGAGELGRPLPIYERARCPEQIQELGPGPRPTRSEPTRGLGPTAFRGQALYRAAAG